jgi:hypothetical protein
MRWNKLNRHSWPPGVDTHNWTVKTRKNRAIRDLRSTFKIEEEVERYRLERRV